MVRVRFVCLFGNVGFDFSDASGNHGLNCSCDRVWLEQVVSHWRRPELCRK